MWWIFVTSAVTIYFLWNYYSSKRRVGGLHKKPVFITGCDSGFGNLLASRLDGQGVPVFAGCLTDDGAQQLKEKSTDRLHTIKLDVTSPESIRQAYDYVMGHLPEGTALWAIVNNAGIIHCLGPVEFLSRQDYLNMLNVNFLGTVEVVARFLPALKKSKGRIVNMCSMSAMVPAMDYAAYAASKYAVMGYTDTLRAEKAIWGISVSSIFPGLVATNLFSSYSMEKKKARWTSLTSEIKEEYGEDYNERAEQFHNNLGKMSEDPKVVVDAYEHALFSRTPRTHYYPGNLSKLVAVQSRILPRPWFETIYTAAGSPPLPKVLQKEIGAN